MAAFSQQYQSFLLDSSSYQYQPHISTTALLPPHHFHIQQEPPFSCVDQSSKISISDTEVSFVKNQSPENSMVVDKLENSEQVTQKVTTPMGKKRRTRNGSSLSTSSPLSKDSIEVGGKKQKKSSGGVKVKGEDKKNEEKKDQKKNHEEPPTGYIHVRARRGQATDSHSLAERVRREKISERMKILQKLVPGCDKVTGKALVLDEIINYVQSLQNQVEFLSMKLASVNPMFFDLEMDIDNLLVSSSTPDQKLNSIPSPSSAPAPPLPSNQATAFADTTTTLMTTTSNFPAANNDYLLDYSSPIFQQGQRSNFFLEHTGSGGPFWDAEDQGQKFLNPYGFGNNTCSLN